MDDTKLAAILAQEMEGLEEESMQLPSIELRQEVSNPEDRTVDKKNDYTFARETIRRQLQLMDQAGIRALQNALSCDQPRMMEVFSQLMSTMTGTAEKLLKIQKQMNELEGVTLHPGQGTINAENVYFGSTNELLEDDGSSQKDEGLIIEGQIPNGD